MELFVQPRGLQELLHGKEAWCADCGKSFNLSACLIRHLRTHTGERLQEELGPAHALQDTHWGEALPLQ
jgi:hypothetical protein